MGILQSPSVLPGQVGVIGALKYMVTTDNISTVLTAGYLNNIDLAVFPINSTDVIGCLYSFNQQTNTGTFGIFTVTITNGVITLVDWSNPGDVLLPVVNNHFANFNGTSGQIKDSGYLPSDASLTNVAMVNTPTIVNTIAYFDDVNGSISNKPGPGGGSAVTNLGDIYAGGSGSNGAFRSYPISASSGWFGVLANDNMGNFSCVLSNDPLDRAVTWNFPNPFNGQAKVLVAASTTPFVNGHFPVASGTSGLMVDSGISATNLQNSTNIKAATTANIGGGGAGPINITVAGLTTSSVVVASVATSSNPVSVIKAVAGTGNFDVTFDADPGATCTLNYIAFIASQ